MWTLPLGSPPSPGVCLLQSINTLFSRAVWSYQFYSWPVDCHMYIKNIVLSVREENDVGLHLLWIYFWHDETSTLLRTHPHYNQETSKHSLTTTMPPLFPLVESTSLSPTWTTSDVYHCYIYKQHTAFIKSYELYTSPPPSHALTKIVIRCIPNIYHTISFSSYSTQQWLSCQTSKY